ncbi:MAG: hypothetical protein M5U16_09385 [Hyphomicrobium sp.]|nr:hypothetical protein [Hyphomicrobium sp.]
MARAEGALRAMSPLIAAATLIVLSSFGAVAQEPAAPAGATPSTGAAETATEPSPQAGAREATPRPSEDLRGLTPEQAANRLAVEARQAFNRAEKLAAAVDIRKPETWPPDMRQDARKYIDTVLEHLRSALDKFNAIIRDYPETNHAVTLIGGR